MASIGHPPLSVKGFPRFIGDNLTYGKGRERVGKICETETIVVPVRND